MTHIMSDKMRLSGIQIFWMMMSMEIGMTLLLTISPAIRDAKQDAWIAMIIGSVIGILITFVAAKVSLRYPGQTLIEFSQAIFGKWLGKLFVIPYFAMWYSVLPVIVREASDFLHLSLFVETPLWVIVFSLYLVIVYMTCSGGIETIARCSEIFGPLILITLTVVTILGVNNFHWERIIPVYADSGWQAILKGSLPIASFLGESVMIMMLIPFASEQGKVMKSAVGGVTAAAVLTCITTIAVILTFGNIAANMWYPFNRMIRFISVMDFIQNMDALIVIVWLLSIFTKVSLILFAASYGSAQWLGVKNWRKLIWGIAPIEFVVTLLFPDVDASAVNYPEKFWIPYVLPVNLVGFPLLLWGLSVIRKHMGAGKNRQT